MLPQSPPSTYTNPFTSTTVPLTHHPCCVSPHVLQALKGLALHRLGRAEEGRALLEEAKEKGPADEPTLQAMTLYYRETGQCE